MKFEPVTALNVGLDFGSKQNQHIISLGRLAIRNRTIYFEYDAEFLARQLNVSPVRLPLQNGLQSFDKTLFEGLPGLFNDSLPDGWGRLLFDRAVRTSGNLLEHISPLVRLAYVGSHGMGALTYKPDQSDKAFAQEFDLDWFASNARAVLAGEADDVLHELLALNGSSAGARPKAVFDFNRTNDQIVYGNDNTPDDFEPWLVKFANAQDGLDAGAIEYAYAEMARAAGLDVMPTHLFPAAHGAGYFASKRFDRDNDGSRIHMHTACGLLHSDYRMPTLDYQDLLELTMLLTRDIRETEKIYRMAVFNVLAHNRDDHSKNFSFLMDQSGAWTVSPAYDITFSSGPGGEQSTVVMGQGKAPSLHDLRKLGEQAGFNHKKCGLIIDQTCEALSQWKTLAKLYAVSASNIALIGKHMKI